MQIIKGVLKNLLIYNHIFYQYAGVSDHLHPQ